MRHADSACEGYPLLCPPPSRSQKSYHSVVQKLQSTRVAADRATYRENQAQLALDETRDELNRQREQANVHVVALHRVLDEIKGQRPGRLTVEETQRLSTQIVLLEKQIDNQVE